MNEIRVFSPATVSNVACGFDILGFPLESIGDEMVVKKTIKKGIVISKIDGFNLPFDVNKNVASVSAQALIDCVKPDFGFEIEIYKKIKPGSGIGSSAASATSSVYAINELLGRPFNKLELTEFAMRGELISSNSEHADNIAPALFGGFNLVKSLHPLEVLQLPTPKDLYVVIIHPQIEIKTSESRGILPKMVSLSDATKQLSNLGGLVHALHTNDYELLKKSLNDHLVEKYRSKLIPHFDELKSKSIAAGAIGCSISGSGPSVFALTKGNEIAINVELIFKSIYAKSKIDFATYVSKISSNGVTEI
ncbi:homoserine kinase [Flavobacteriaceae bacterium]|jgi:homoserine kinase|nr:homoserine kinase [Flavobacteriaceae bacterium]MDC1492926.1 homoserine kinase [Flavobacteriaceae bacterium]